jgi:3-O-methylgallate 3,4-dioxygenase
MIRDAIESFPEDARVAVIASGGLSHHVVDESLDEIILAALAAQDLDALRALPAERLKGGSSELRNWIAMAPSIRGLTGKMCAYQAAYRNAAGIGGGMGFAAWTA